MKKRSHQKFFSASSESPFWIYGLHAVYAALENPRRACVQVLYLSAETLDPVKAALEKRGIPCHKGDKGEFQRLFPPEAVHQGLAAQIFPLTSPSFESLLQNEDQDLWIATLDQVTDPHNMGAIARSAAAFGLHALLLTERHKPAETSPVLYKAASGALERLPLISVSNLARALEHLRKAGFWNLGLDEKGTQDVSQSDLKGRINLILGSEGKGLRRLTQEHCDLLLRLPTQEKFATLNVSTAAAVVFYEAYRQRRERS